MNTETIESTPRLAEADSVTVAVVGAVADRTDADPLELPPLSRCVDPDALESLFSPTATGDRRTGRVDFTYCGHLVTVRCERGRGLSIHVEAADADE